MDTRIVITGIGLAAPNGNNMLEFRAALLEGKSGVAEIDVRHMGKKPAGLCHFDEFLYQKKKVRKRGTRVGSIAIYCANECLKDSGIDLEFFNRDRVGVYLGITEHGNVETENEIHDLYQNNLNTQFWSHHHNPRTVANNPAGEVTLNLGITGPHYTIGAACAAGNLGLIQAVQMLRLGEIDQALAGGVSESPQTFGIFAAFQSQGALGEHADPSRACRPLALDRNGIAVSEGGAIYLLERLEDALRRKAKIYGEIVGHHTNSDATDFVLPNPERQAECMLKAMEKAGLNSQEIDLVSMHATGTKMGDIKECQAISRLFDDTNAAINCSKGLIGHAMGAAGALELAGNLLSFEDGLVHPCHKIDELDPECAIRGLVLDRPLKKSVKTILNNSFGMLGINSTVIVKKFQA